MRCREVARVRKGRRAQPRAGCPEPGSATTPAPPPVTRGELLAGSGEAVGRLPSVLCCAPVGASPGTVGMSPITGQVQLQEGGVRGGHDLDTGPKLKPLDITGD